MESYFNIVRTKLVDSVPKAITLTLIRKSQAQMQDALVSNLYRDDLLDALLDESEETVRRRQRCREVLALMKTSLAAITEVQSSDL